MVRLQSKPLRRWQVFDQLKCKWPTKNQFFVVVFYYRISTVQSTGIVWAIHAYRYLYWGSNANCCEIGSNIFFSIILNNFYAKYQKGLNLFASFACMSTALTIKSIVTAHRNNKAATVKQNISLLLYNENSIFPLH